MRDPALRADRSSRGQRRAIELRIVRELDYESRARAGDDRRRRAHPRDARTQSLAEALKESGRERLNAPRPAYDELRLALRNGVERLISERSDGVADDACSLSPLACSLGFPVSPWPLRHSSSSPAPDRFRPTSARWTQACPASALDPDVHNAHSVAEHRRIDAMARRPRRWRSLCGAHDQLLPERAGCGLRERCRARPEPDHGDASQR